MPTTIPLHAGHSTPPALPTRLAIGVGAGLLATVVANVPTTRQPDGRTPSFVTAAALTGDALVDVSERAATVVHYGVGGLAGGLLAALELVFEAALEPMLFLATVRLYTVPHLLAGAAVLAALYVVFAYGVLPRYDLPAERMARIRQQWAVSATTYTLSLLVLVPVLTVFMT